MSLSTMLLLTLFVAGLAYLVAHVLVWAMSLS